MTLKSFICVVVASLGTLWAEPDAKLFFVSFSLKTNAAPVVEVAPQQTPPQVDLALTSSRLLEVPLELATQRYEGMNGGRLLVVPEPVFEPGGLYGVLKGNVFDPITNPEVVKVGKVHMTGGVVGAIKKKNPFYLLNPLVFAIDW